MLESRSAIGVHHTPTVDQSWDGSANEARLKDDGGASYLRKFYGWVDPSGDPATKAAYKFGHHEVDADGNIGGANVRGCIAGIAVLNGGRGGANIPDADRTGVHSHLAAHMRDAEMEPPELKSSSSSVEYRSFPSELRIVPAPSDSAMPSIGGHAAIFDVPTDRTWGFIEIIKPGFFDAVLATADVRALINHDENLILGRTKPGTLMLSVDDVGLTYAIDPPETSYAKDLIVSIGRGDIDGSSFAFSVRKEEWSTDANGATQRTLLEAEDLFDVSPVTYPAYVETDVQLRSILSQAGIPPAELAGSIMRSLRGGLTNEDIRLLRSSRDVLDSLVDSDGQKLTDVQTDGRTPIAVLRRQLQIADLI
jgi:HK97 family phage prohead protease